MNRRASGRPAMTCLKFAALLGLIVLNPPPANCQKEMLSIKGQVRTTDGGPLPTDVTVRLEEAEGTVVARQFVGSNGKFEFSDLTGSLYRLIVTAKGFQTVSQDVDMYYLASRYPNMYLVPLVQKKTGSPSPSTTSATDLAAPKKAQKEYERGHRALHSGNPEEARGHLEKAVAEYPCYARAQAALGVSLSMLRLFVPAEAAFKKSMECDGGFLEAYVQLGILLNLESKYAENELNLQRGLAHFPNEWQLHYRLGAAYYGLKDYEKAEEEYSKAQSINPTPPSEFHVKLADVYLKRKEFAKACAEMQTYLRVDPNGQFAEETKSLMRRMESAGVVPSAQAKGEQQPH